MRKVIVAISLLLLLAFAVVVRAWVRSYFVMDEWSMADEEGRVIGIVSYQGAVHYTRAGKKNSAPRRWSYDWHRIPNGATWTSFYTVPGQIKWKWFGFMKIRSRSAVPGTVRLGLSLTPWLIIDPYDAWVFPYWAAAVATGVVPAHRLAWYVRRWHRRRSGRCVRCGYDLRASTERCPECGSDIKRRQIDQPVTVAR